MERVGVLGGVATNTGTLPSKTLRASVVALTSSVRGGFGTAHARLETLTIEDLLWRAPAAIDREREAVEDELRRSRVDILEGSAAFVDANTLEIASAERAYRVSAERVVIAVGSRPRRPPDVDFDGRTVLDSDELLRLREIPRTLTVVGAGVVGIELASIFAALGTRVTLVDACSRILEFVDDEIVEALQYHLGGLGLALRLGQEVVAVERASTEGAVVRLQGGERIPSQSVVWTAGRQGETNDLGLAAAGLRADARGRIAVDSDQRTARGHIFAAGDVVGQPPLASTSWDQGRRAALAAFDVRDDSHPVLVPVGIHSLPEIAFVGSTERDLVVARTPYVRGTAPYRELSRAEIDGDRTGMIKLLVHAETRLLVGAHLLGTNAGELVHLGQTVMAAGLSVNRLAEAVYGEPTFASGYRVAALDAVRRLATCDGTPACAAA